MVESLRSLIDCDGGAVPADLLLTQTVTGRKTVKNTAEPLIMHALDGPYIGRPNSWNESSC